MTTQHMAMAAAITELLRLDPVVAGGRVYLGRVRPFNAATKNAIVVRIERSASQQAQVLGGWTSWNTLLAIECYGKDDDGALPGSEADTVVERVFAKLETVPPLGDGVGVIDIEPLAGNTLEWDLDALDTSMACITARFVVKHQTTGKTLTL